MSGSLLHYSPCPNPDCPNISVISHFKNTLGQLEESYRAALARHEREKRALTSSKPKLERQIQNEQPNAATAFEDLSMKRLIREKNEEISRHKYQAVEAREERQRLETENKKLLFDIESLRNNLALELKAKEMDARRLKAEAENIESHHLGLYRQDQMVIAELRAENDALNRQVSAHIRDLDQAALLRQNLIEDITAKRKEISENFASVQKKVNARLLKHSKRLVKQILAARTLPLKRVWLNLWALKCSQKKAAKSTMKIAADPGPDQKVLRRVKSKLSTSVLNAVYDVFVSSVDSAKKKRGNSLTIFSMNMREFLGRASFFSGALDSLRALTKHEAKALPAPSEEMESTVNNFNAFICRGVREAAETAGKISGAEEQFVPLFKLMMLKFRAKHPIRTDSDPVQRSTSALLDTQILASICQLAKTLPPSTTKGA